MTKNPEQERRETCRRETLRYLATYHRSAWELDAIRHHLEAKGYDFTVAELEDALDLLCRWTPEPLATRVLSSLGATPAWEATPAGVLAIERGLR